MCWWGNHLFVIFAVLDVSLAVNLCINCSFFTFISLWLGLDHWSVYDWDLFSYQSMTGICWFISLWLGLVHLLVYDWDLLIHQSMTGTWSFISLWLGFVDSSVYDWDLIIYQSMTGTCSVISVWLGLVHQFCCIFSLLEYCVIFTDKTKIETEIKSRNYTASMQTEVCV